MEIEYIYNIITEQAQRLNQRYDPVANPLNLDQLRRAFNSSKINNEKFILGLRIFENLCTDKVVNFENVPLITEFHNILDQFPDAKPKIYFHLDSLLRRYIFDNTDLNSLLSLAEIAVQLKNFNDNFKEAYYCLENQTYSLFHDMLINLYKSHDEGIALNGAYYLYKVTELGYDIGTISDIFNEGVNTLIEDRNFIKYENDLKIPINPAGDLKIIELMLLTKIDSKNRARLEKYREFIREKYAIQDINAGIQNPKEKIMDFKEVKLDNNEDFKNLKRSDKVIATDPSCKCVFSKGKISNKEVKIKEYDLKNVTDQTAKKQLENSIEIEAKCMKFLSDKSENFLKYYGCSLNKNPGIFFLVYEDFGVTLKEYIQSINDSGADNFELLKLTEKIIKLFTELANFNIYHGNINLNSILTDGSEAKLTDFQHAAIKDNGQTADSSDRELRSCYYSDENQREYEANDVYALGLVILQMASKRTISNLTKDQLAKLIDSFDIKYNNPADENSLSKLLRQMLITEPRPKFSQLLKVAKDEITKTLSIQSSHRDHT